MKHIEAPFICKGFVICVGHLNAHDIYDFTTKETTTDGVFSQLGFCLDGGAVLNDKNGHKVMDLVAGQLYDFKDLYGKEYTMNTGAHGGTWFCINPTPATKRYKYELIKESQIKTITGDDFEQTVICVYGSIKVNGKDLIGKQYARILNNKTAVVTTQANSMALYFYEEK
jgi:hypothetical protein